MSAFQIAALLIVLAAVFNYINYVTLKLPQSIGIALMGLLASLSLIAADALVPEISIFDDLRAFMNAIDFHRALMEGMLGFILFAGALHVSFDELKAQKWIVLLSASLGLMLSTAIVGFAFWWLAGVPLAVALVFGALISPTDPVAVLGLLKSVKVPRSLQVKITGESLFNDGVAVVVFLILTEIAFGAGSHGSGDGGPGALHVVRLFAQEALGGAVLGAAAGWVVVRLLRPVDQYVLEIMLTLALVMGTYALALALHMSGPIAAVLAGLVIGNSGFEQGMSDMTRDHVENFWHLIDEILNAVLFLLIGIEVLAIPFGDTPIGVLIVCIPLVLIARTCAVGAPMALLSYRRSFTPGALPILVWGGLRGGISVALALSLPDSEHKPLILSATYIVVIFSIIIQGLTVSPVVRAFGPRAGREENEAAALRESLGRST